MARPLKGVNYIDCHWARGIALFLGLSTLANGQTLPSGANFNFEGRLILAVSDADMVASAYLDGQLGPIEGQDVLSLIQLNRPVGQLKAVTIEASNSVTGPPSSVAVSPDGRYAVVIETRGTRPTAKANPRLSDLPPGKRISVIDLLDADHPKLSQRLDGPEQPLSVQFTRDGAFVAITYRPQDTKQSPLAVYRFEQGKRVDLSRPEMPGYSAGDVINGLAFHPSQDELVVLNATQSTLSFFTFKAQANTFRLTPWGNAVRVDPEPFKAQFTPNGRFVVVNAMLSRIGAGFGHSGWSKRGYGERGFAQASTCVASASGGVARRPDDESRREVDCDHKSRTKHATLCECQTRLLCLLNTPTIGP